MTVLTSYDEADLVEAGYTGSVEDLVARRAAQARDIGVDGIVCAAPEAGRVRTIIGPERLIVTPGIRPTGAAAGDQKRILTPAEALRLGATHLVVARPIIGAADPRAAADTIVNEMAGALSPSCATSRRKGSSMPKGYIVARITVTDPEAYAAYAAGATEAIAKYQGRPLVRGGAHEALEGEARPRNVVIEFDSVEQARRIITPLNTRQPRQSGMVPAWPSSSWWRELDR